MYFKSGGRNLHRLKIFTVLLMLCQFVCEWIFNVGFASSIISYTMVIFDAKTCQTLLLYMTLVIYMLTMALLPPLCNGNLHPVEIALCFPRES